MRIFFILLIGFICCDLSAQESGRRGTIKVEKNTCELVKGSDSIYAKVDEVPEFKGGPEKMMKWMNANLKIPGEREGIYATQAPTVFASFIVLADGKITDVTVLKTDNPSYEAEALRLLRMMPDWNPGVCNKKKVPVKVNYPIKFGMK